MQQKAFGLCGFTTSIQRVSYCRLLFFDASGANAILAVSMAVCRAGASASQGHLGVLGLGSVVE